MAGLNRISSSNLIITIQTPTLFHDNISNKQVQNHLVNKALNLVDAGDLSRVRLLNVLHSTRSAGDILTAVLSNVHIALDTASTNGIVLHDLVPVHELVHVGVLLDHINAAVHEVHTGLHSDQHTLSQVASGTQGLVSHTSVTLHVGSVAAHVVHIDSHEVSQTVRHEVASHVGLQNLLLVSLEESLLQEALNHHAVRVGVDVHPVYAGLHHQLALAVHLQNGLVNESLLVGELAVHRAGGGDIAGVALVLRTHIHQQPLAVMHLAVIGSTSMSVVENAAVAARSADGNERDVTASTLEVVRVEEHRLNLRLVNLGLNGTHVVQMSLRTDLGHVAVNLHLLGGLDHTALRDGLEQVLLIDVVLLDSVEVSGHGEVATVAVLSLGDVHHLRSELLEVRGNVVSVEHLVHLVQVLVVLSAVNGTHPHGEGLGQMRNEQDGLLGVALDGSEEIGLLHSEQIVELAILAEENVRI